MAQRIVVVANKTWEAAPLLSTLFSPRSRPAVVRPIDRIYDPDAHPCDWHEPPEPRALLVAGDTTVQVFCIEDWMDPDAGSSNTAEKMRVLPRIFQSSAELFDDPAEVVVAFGTAGIPSSIAFNGCVTVGTNTVVYDPFAGRATRALSRDDGTMEPMWNDPRVGDVLPSRLPQGWFRDLPPTVRATAEARFVSPPIHPATPMTVLAGNGFAALSTVNVTNYDDYVWADPASLAHFSASVDRHEVGSQETTHGLIRIAAENALGRLPTFLYVSGITDSIGWFDMEVSPRAYAQNFAAAHNAGVTLGWLLPELAKL